VILPGVTLDMSDTTTPISRREFCGACVASCATLATIVTGCGGDGSPTGPSGGGGGSATDLALLPGPFANARVRVTTTGTPLANVGGAARVESNAGLFLISRTSDTTFTVIDGTCTHEGCTITGATSSQFVCPCHGSRYSLTGQVQQGPAKASLRQYASTFADGVLSIAV
jgi:Rieske Fe-S protein